MKLKKDPKLSQSDKLSKQYFVKHMRKSKDIVFSLPTFKSANKFKSCQEKYLIVRETQHII